MSKQNKVWFVTGASKGLGLALVHQLLSEGYAVAATSRSLSSLKKAVNTTSENFLPLEVDLLNEESVKAAMADTLKKFGRVDSIVNNAGYGQMGALEELSDREARDNFDVNVFGTLNVIRQAMPHLRAQKSGHIFNISSVGGYTGNFPGWAIYCSTKFAVSGLTEGLHADAKPFGVKVTLVYPGYFRTEFLASSSVGLPANPIADYKDARASQQMHLSEINSNQPGDPDKAAKAMIEVAKSAEAPLHLFLGKDAFDMAGSKIAAVEADLQKWKELSRSTDL